MLHVFLCMCQKCKSGLKKLNTVTGNSHWTLCQSKIDKIIDERSCYDLIKLRPVWAPLHTFHPPSIHFQAKENKLVQLTIIESTVTCEKAPGGMREVSNSCLLMCRTHKTQLEFPHRDATQPRLWEVGRGRGCSSKPTSKQLRCICIYVIIIMIIIIITAGLQPTFLIPITHKRPIFILFSSLWPIDLLCQKGLASHSVNNISNPAMKNIQKEFESWVRCEWSCRTLPLLQSHCAADLTSWQDANDCIC